MADTALPNDDGTKAGKAGADKAARPAKARRRTDVAPRAEAAARRTTMVQFAIFAFAAVVTIDSVVGDKGLLQTFRAQREYDQARASIHQLRRQNSDLRERVRRLREDPAAIEEAARRHLGLVKPGEVLVIIRDAEKR